MTKLHWVTNFLEALAAEKDAAANTMEAYARDLNDYAGFVGNKFETVKRAQIEEYLQSLEAEGRSASTRNRRLSAMKQFHSFLYSEGLAKTNPTIGIKGAKMAKRLPQTMSIADVDTLIRTARESKNKNAPRLWCFAELLYATGMRVTEMVSLPVSAVRGDPRMLLIKGKGGRERMVPLSDPARRALQGYLAHRDKKQALAVAKGKPESPYLFPSHSKEGHLSRVRFFQQIKELAKEAGLDPEKISPHTMRHAFATHLLENGADLRSIQTLLGHSDIATTEVYTHVLEDRLKDVVQNLHPLAEDAK